MSRHIDAGLAIKSIDETRLYRAKDVERLINEIPTADVELVRHGHWILQEDNKHSCCSSCNFKRNISTQYGWDYCPNCGAKMDAKEKEE